MRELFWLVRLNGMEDNGMIKIKGLVILALSLMVVLVLAGGFSLNAEIKEDVRKTEEAQAAVMRIGTSKECVEAFVKAYDEEDEYLLEALCGKDIAFTFDYRDASFYPVRLISLEPVPAVFEASSKFESEYDAVLEVKFMDGNISRKSCRFTLYRAEGPWHIIRWEYY